MIKKFGLQFVHVKKLPVSSDCFLFYFVRVSGLGWFREETERSSLTWRSRARLLGAAHHAQAQRARQLLAKRIPEAALTRANRVQAY